MPSDTSATDQKTTILSRFKHPGIVPFIGAGVDADGRSYCMLDYLPGADLAAVWDQITTSRDAGPSGVSKVAALKKSFLTAAARRAGAERWNELAHKPGSVGLEPAPPEELRAEPTPAVDDPPGGYVRHVVELMSGAARTLAEIYRENVIHGDLKARDFMLSPEGKRLVLTNLGLVEDLGGTGPAADVCALGLILGELLILQRLPETPEHRSNPVMLKSWTLDSTLDRDLDAIIARATTENTRESFQSADELAENLDRYLTGQLLTFQKPTLRAVTRRWRKAHHAEFRLGAFVAVVVVAAIIGVIVAWRQATAAERHAEQERGHAIQAQTRAEKERARAENGYALARAAVNRLTQIGEALPSRQPGLQKVQQELLTSSVEYYENFIAQEGGNPTMRENLVDTHFRLANVLNTLGNRQDALDHASEAARLWLELSEDQPDSWWRQHLSAGHISPLQVGFLALALEMQLGQFEPNENLRVVLKTMKRVRAFIPPAEIDKMKQTAGGDLFQSMFDLIQTFVYKPQIDDQTIRVLASNFLAQSLRFNFSEVSRLEKVVAASRFDRLSALALARACKQLADNQANQNRLEDALQPQTGSVAATKNLLLAVAGQVSVRFGKVWRDRRDT